MNATSLAIAGLRKVKSPADSSESAQLFFVTGFLGEALLLERLREVGFSVGQKIELLGRAPFGGAILTRFGITVIALRFEEAQCILVQAI